jgi:hypothetical protein
MDKVNAVDEVVRTMKNNLQVRAHTQEREQQCIYSGGGVRRGSRGIRIGDTTSLSRSACIVSSALPPLNLPPPLPLSCRRWTTS